MWTTRFRREMLRRWEKRRAAINESDWKWRRKFSGKCILLRCIMLFDSSVFRYGRSSWAPTQATRCPYVRVGTTDEHRMSVFTVHKSMKLAALSTFYVLQRFVLIISVHMFFDSVCWQRLHCTDSTSRYRNGGFNIFLNNIFIDDFFSMIRLLCTWVFKRNIFVCVFFFLFVPHIFRTFWFD